MSDRSLIARVETHLGLQGAYASVMPRLLARSRSPSSRAVLHLAVTSGAAAIAGTVRPRLGAPRGAK